MTDDAGRFDAGIPRGTAGLALELAARAADAASRLTGRRHDVDRDAVLAHLLLPLVVGDEPASAPARAAADGWVHADLLPEDEALFEILAGEAAGAEQLAVTAQECRLPVTPYRDRAALWGQHRDEPPTVRRRDPADVSVIDLTAMWAGPLATTLLATWGADVLTVEPPMRRDGLRGSPAQFDVLDRGKKRRPWDLRAAPDRALFETAVRSADVLVESFSPRVMPNLGYGPPDLRRLNPRLTMVALRAFPGDSPEASWVAYGRGVHAASGLGVAGGRPQPALLAYPDPLAGIAAFGAILVALGQADGSDVEISLAGAMAPLLGTADAPLGSRDDDAIDALRRRTGGRPGPIIAAG